MAALLRDSLATGVCGAFALPRMRRAFIMAANFKNRLSPEATDSRLRMWVAGCEKGWDSRDVIRNRLSLRFLQQRAAVLGPSTSDRARLRFREGLHGGGGGQTDGDGNGDVSRGRTIGPGVRGVSSVDVDVDVDIEFDIDDKGSVAVAGDAGGISTDTSACAGWDADIRWEGDCEDGGDDSKVEVDRGRWFSLCEGGGRSFLTTWRSCSWRTLFLLLSSGRVSWTSWESWLFEPEWPEPPAPLSRCRHGRNGLNDPRESTCVAILAVCWPD